MSDEVKELPENNFSAILNFQLSSENDTHWVSLYSRKTLLTPVAMKLCIILILTAHLFNNK